MSAPNRTPVTVKKAAEWVGRDPATIRRWVTARLISGLKTEDGQRIVILQEVVKVDARLRREALRNGRARLRRDHMRAIAEAAGGDTGRPA